MIFLLTQRQQEIQKELIELSKQLVDSTLSKRDVECRFSRDLWKVFNASGLDLLVAPEQLGGRGYGALDSVIALETLGQYCADTGLVFALAAHALACIHPLISAGNPEQIKFWLTKIKVHGLIGAHAITEPEAGSDVFSMKTMALKQNGGYSISGQKCYVSNAPICDFLVVYARTTNNNNFFDFSAFIVDRKSTGLQISEHPHEKVGLRTTAMGDVFLDKVFVEEHHRIGSEGSGGAIFQVSMEWERTCLFALYVGLMQRQLDMTLARSQSRQQFGRSIGENQAIGHKLADMMIRLETARLAVYKAAWLLDQGSRDQMSSAIAKLLVAENAVKNSMDALHIHGAYGVLSGEIERQLRNTLPSSILSGTTETLKNNLVHQLQLRSRNLPQYS